MTELEDRLRQELHEMAQRLVPTDLRPLCQPSPQAWSRRARWLVPVASVLAVALITGLTLAGNAPSRNRRPLAAWHPPAADPPELVLAGLSASTGLHGLIKILSPESGRVVTTLPSGPALNFGLALSPDLRSVFVAGLADGRVEIDRVDVATRRVSRVAPGVHPAISPDGRYLAYVTGQNFNILAILNLRTGKTRLVNLVPQIGNDGCLLYNSSIAWLGDGTEVVIEPGQFAGDLDLTLTCALRPAMHPAEQSASDACGLQGVPRNICLVVVGVGSRRLSEHRIYVPGKPASDVVNGDLSGRRSFLIAKIFSSAAPGIIDQVSLRGAGAVEHQVATLRTGAIAEAFAPDGDRVVYMAHSSPPPVKIFDHGMRVTGGGSVHWYLWVAMVRDGHLIDQHRLFTLNGDFQLGEAAW